MVRVCCVYIPALALQLLLRRLGCQGNTPVAVLRGVEILWANRCAQGLGVRRGMRVQAARALAVNLHAEEVADTEVEQGVRALWHTLVQYTPGVEPAVDQPGLLWLDPNGLQNLYPSLQYWGKAVHTALQQQGFHNTVAVGFNRYFTYALACSGQSVCVAPSAQHERQTAERVWLTKLHVSAELRDALAVLGIHTLGAMLALPLVELRQRFGEEAERIYRLATGTCITVLQAQHATAPVCMDQQIEPPDADQARLLFVIKSMLQRLLPTLRARCEALTVLHVRLQITAKLAHHERLQPAVPTLDERTLLELLRLRLMAVQLSAPVENITLHVEGIRVQASQLEMLARKPRRDVHAANAALAKVRAALGEGSITQARLCDAHLPEARYVWESVVSVKLPHPPAAPLLAPLVRQVLRDPQPLPPRPKRQPFIRNLVGPFCVQSHWWEEPVVRNYYYAQTDRDLLWIYYQGHERRWYLQGWVD